MQCDECKSALRKDKLTGGHWCPVCSFENAHREKLAAQSELASLRQRVSELEAIRAELMAQLAAFGNADAPNGETLSKRIDAFLDANLPQIVTPNNCRHCQRDAEKMREAAATLSDEMFADEVADAIRALPLQACDGCNPLAPSRIDEIKRDLASILPDLELELAEVGACDHSVNICSCGLRNAVETVARYAN